MGKYLWINVTTNVTLFSSGENICRFENANKFKNTRFRETLLPAKCHRFCVFASGKVWPLKRTVYLAMELQVFHKHREMSRFASQFPPTVYHNYVRGVHVAGPPFFISDCSIRVRHFHI